MVSSILIVCRWTTLQLSISYRVDWSSSKDSTVTADISIDDVSIGCVDKLRTIACLKTIDLVLCLSIVVVPHKKQSPTSVCFRGVKNVLINRMYLELGVRNSAFAMLCRMLWAVRERFELPKRIIAETVTRMRQGPAQDDTRVMPESRNWVRPGTFGM